MATKTPLRIALLLADTPVPSVLSSRGTYHDIFSDLLQQSLDASGRSAEFEIKVNSYDVVGKMEYPDEEELAKTDCVMITGSAASAYASLPWIDKLVSFTRRVAEERPAVRIIGICFGHQIVARAFGAEVVKNPKGWELGTTECSLTDDGKRYLGYEGVDGAGVMRIQQVHQDYVPSVPESFINLACTPISPIQGLALPYPSSSPVPALPSASSPGVDGAPTPQRELHILTLQGHPEFDTAIVEKIISVRETKGVLTQAFADESRRRAREAHDGLRLGRAVLGVLGV